MRPSFPHQPSRFATRAAFLLIGFSAVVVQIVLMRELIVVFHGNEASLGLMLASWLLWTAAGSTLPTKFAHSLRGACRLVAALQFATALVLPLTLIIVRSAPAFFHATPGEVLGPGRALVASLAALGGFCTVSGWLFAAGSHLEAMRCAPPEGAPPVGLATSRVYLLDVAGSAAGGLVASLALARYLNASQTLALVAGLNILAGVWLAVPAARVRAAMMAACAALFAFVGFPVGAPWLEAHSLARLWHGFDLVANRNTIYGNLVVTQTEGTRSLFENGVIVSVVPDAAGAEEAVHYALLQHPVPRSLLLIGGGTNGSVAQALQHASIERLDYVELDPAVLSVARDYLSAASEDKRVHVHNTDGRLFVKAAREKWDVIIANVPDPQTAQLNRFYTIEFFQEAGRRLLPGGVFSLRVSASENYVTPRLADFLRCINATLIRVFPGTGFLPGETFHFFASTKRGQLTSDPNVLMERLRARSLQAAYVREYYLPFRMMPDRMREIGGQIAPRPGTPINSDLAPVAYYFDIALWSSRFSPAGAAWMERLGRVRFWWFFAGAAVILLAAVFAAQAAFAARASTARARLAAGASVAAMGFTFMGLELLLLLAFQSLHGYVYHQLALLIAGFMAGCAAGSWRGIRSCAAGTRAGRPRLHRLAVLQLAAAGAPLFLAALFVWLARLESPWLLSWTAQALFPLLAGGCGALAGYQFPLASSLFMQADQRPAPGALYALDLVGACAAALLLSVYLVPVFGLLRTAFVMALVNLAPLPAVVRAARDSVPLQRQPGN